MSRSVALLALCALPTACFNPSSNDIDIDIDTVGTDTDPTTSGTTGVSTTDDPTTTTGTTTADPTTDTSGDPVCGDGEVNGDEVCDDGTNDGTYGSCLDDCSAPAAFCGDGELNGPEACDDGVNDGSYGGCTGTCELAAFCGDGDVNGDEGCDLGDQNSNSLGCNVDCVISGSQIGTYNVDNLVYCEGALIPQPAFNTQGNIYIAVGGQCNNDSTFLLEFDSDTNLVAEHQDNVVLPERNLQALTARGDDWLLATYGCNYVISAEGNLEAEVCTPQQDRYQGYDVLAARDDTVYLAQDFNDIALYGAGSPAMGDQPQLLIGPPPNGEWSFYDSTFGPNDTILRAGRYRFDNTQAWQGYVERLTSAGNSAEARWHSDVEYFTDIVPSPDGGYVTFSPTPNAIVRKLNANLTEAWSMPVPAQFGAELDVDSLSFIVLAFRDNNGMYQVVKWSEDGQTELWSHTMPDWSGFGSLAVAPDDSTWVVHQYLDITEKLDVAHFAP